MIFAIKKKYRWWTIGTCLTLIFLAALYNKRDQTTTGKFDPGFPDSAQPPIFHGVNDRAINRNHLTKDTQNRNSDSGMKTAESFLKAFTSIDAKLGGFELRDARSRLIMLAANNLSIDELTLLSNSIREKVYHGEISCMLALRYATENPTQGLEWLIQESIWMDNSSATLAYASAREFDSFPTDDLNRFQNDEKKALFIRGIMKSASASVATSALDYLAVHPDISKQDGTLISKCFKPILKSGKFKESLSLSQSLNDESAKKNMLSIVFSSACNTSPTTAKSLLTSIQDESDRSIAIKSIAGSWGTLEPDKVANWANGLPNLREQDAAKEGLVGAIFDSDPSSALEWARSIHDEDRRESVVAKLVENLRVTDPELLR